MQVTIDPYNSQTGAGTLNYYASKYGTDLNSLLKLNPQITDPNKIQAGAFLNVPDAQTGNTPLMPTINPPAIPATGGINFTPFNTNLGDINSNSFMGIPRTGLDIAKILSDNNAEIQRRREELALASTKTQEESDLEKSLADIRTKAENQKAEVAKQNLQIEREGGGVNFVTGLQGNLAKASAIDQTKLANDEQNLLLKLGLVQEARNAKIKSAETGLAGARDDFQTQLKVYDVIRGEEDRIFDRLKDLNTIQKDKTAKVLDTLKGVDPDTLSPQDQMTIANMASSIGITPSLLIDSLRVQYNKDQADLLYKKSLTEKAENSGTKVDTLTLDERRKLYPELPVSLIGQDEKTIISQLESTTPPSWFKEVASAQGPLSPETLNKIWNEYRLKVIEEARAQSQKETSTTDIPAFLL